MWKRIEGEYMRKGQKLILLGALVLGLMLIVLLVDRVRATYIPLERPYTRWEVIA
jgi:hypothetical protein